ncbi:MAG: prenyltransferase/squalene oxidase repeat-containing protein [Planctomycetota bacterium]
MRFLHSFVVGLLLLSVLSASDDSTFEAVDDKTEAALQASLKWLATKQQKDGSFECGIGNRVGYGYDAHAFGGHVGVTAIAGMAFLANGHVPGSGEYAHVVEGCIDFVTRCAKSNGFITHQQSRMYSHAFAALFLAEAYGMTQRKDVREALERAVRLIVSHQNANGGWRYSPEAADSDLSVVVCLVQALRAANNVGIQVPRSTIDRAIKFIRSLVVKPGEKPSGFGMMEHLPMFAKEGGFHYQDGERVTFAICAAGVTALHGTGIYEGAELDRGLRFLELRYIDKMHEDPKYWRQSPDIRFLPATEGYATNFTGRTTRQGRALGPKVQGFQYFYGHYYAAQAFHQAGGSRWERWYSRIRSDFLAIQFPDGHCEDEVGSSYATSMFALILALPKGYLPIFQR